MDQSELQGQGGPNYTSTPTHRFSLNKTKSGQILNVCCTWTASTFTALANKQFFIPSVVYTPHPVCSFALRSVANPLQSNFSVQVKREMKNKPVNN